MRLPRYRVPRLRRKRKPRYKAGVGESSVLGMQYTKEKTLEMRRGGQRRMCEVGLEYEFQRKGLSP